MPSKRKFPDQSVDDTHQPCDVCSSMTGSLEGLNALTSEDGYKHHSKSELRSSAQRGCLSCVVLWAKASELWTEFPIWHSEWDMIAVAVDNRGMRISGSKLPSIDDHHMVGDGLSHEFNSQSLDSLRFAMDVDFTEGAFEMFVSAEQRRYSDLLYSK
jgi:hypothetical protein